MATTPNRVRVSARPLWEFFTFCKFGLDDGLLKLKLEAMLNLGARLDPSVLYVSFRGLVTVCVHRIVVFENLTWVSVELVFFASISRFKVGTQQHQIKHHYENEWKNVNGYHVKPKVEYLAEKSCLAKASHCRKDIGFVLNFQRSELFFEHLWYQLKLTTSLLAASVRSSAPNTSTVEQEDFFWSSRGTCRIVMVNCWCGHSSAYICAF
ncbi:hypothetical protein BpHYR1_050650 [Brachionus plicatilis]|uniref:Uncharacterized protein n=1 Tax=Brachionus plicatilis TaxID=10195 RepID=A0A3M7QLY9_BRAPC|nr:hypothetical protein BpHYR1_050650 [Brachionus plicatilis]